MQTTWSPAGFNEFSNIFERYKDIKQRSKDGAKFQREKTVWTKSRAILAISYMHVSAHSKSKTVAIEFYSYGLSHMISDSIAATLN